MSRPPRDRGGTTRWVAGADGCRDGWVVARRHVDTGEHRVQVVATLAEALDGDPAVLAVDVPIGLPRRAEPGGREADRAARRLLGWPRSASVFSPPSRDALAAKTHAEASTRNRASGPDAPGLSVQAFHLFAKIREADALVTPARQRGDGPTRIVEAHPEVIFAQMNGGTALVASKASREGREARVALLGVHGVADPLAHARACRGRATADDVLDALACAWTAERIRRGAALCLPADPETDPRGLRMEIWA
ncbi:MAG: DUF429 domain-containing protein [Bacteroidota bacterium]